MRRNPNIIVTGTPGCGKTSHSLKLVHQLGKSYKHISISEFAKEHKLLESYDQKLDTSVVNENKLLDLMEVELRKGGVVLDWHVCDIFPERLIDLVVVLRTENSFLYDRLSARGYKDNKIQENLDAEIMEVILQEAQELYASEVVVVLESNSDADMDTNVDRIAQWVQNWQHDHPQGVTNEYEGSESESEGDEYGESESEERD